MSMCTDASFLRFTVGKEERSGRWVAEPMAVGVRGIVGHGTDRESVFVQILGVSQQSDDEVAAADIMCQVAKEYAAVRVVAHILNDGAAVRIAVRLAQFIGGSVRETL